MLILFKLSINKLHLKVVQTVAELRQYLLGINGLDRRSIGFVPTMGALHEGHLSLIAASKNQSALTVCSIFVNPTQFNDKKDFDRYPIQIDTDLEMLIKAGCDVIFLPSVEEVYPNGVDDKAEIDLGFIGTTLEAAHRPGHFEGVVQVVKRLLEIVEPGKLFMGQKDYQQCMVVQRLIDVFEFPIELIVCPTLREPDGLAMSSRNVRLNAGERQSAVKLSKALFSIRERFKSENFSELAEEQLNSLKEDPLIRPEYLAIVNGKTLEPLDIYKEDIPITALIAAKVGEIRLIDNIILQ
jgi:pantoate--beta-alanine ligase